MPTTSNVAISERNAADTHFGKLRQRIMGLDLDTIGIVSSLLSTILERVDKTIDKFKNRKEAGTESFRAEGAAPGPNTWITELKAAILQQTESVKLLAGQHTVTVDVLRDKVARLERRLRRTTWLTSIGFAVTVTALFFALQAFRH